MKRMLILLAFLVLVSGCAEITGERLKEINNQWLKIYTADRRLMADEAPVYAALDDAGKTKWREEGKPTDQSLPAAILDAATDFWKAVNEEAKAAAGD